MRQFTLTCCSTADMSRSYFEEREIPFVCFHFTMDGVEYADDMGISMPIDEFYKRVADGAQPTTSQVNTASYIEFFTPILESGSDIVHITLSSGISGTYSSCIVAAEVLREKYPERTIAIIDSLAASSGYGLLVDYAADLRDSGISASEAEILINAKKLNVHHWVIATDLTSLFRGGRVSKTSYIVGGMLNICPIINVSSEGKLAVRAKCRGKKKAFEYLLKMMEENAEGSLDYSGKCYISNAAFYDDAKKLAELIENNFPKLDGKVLINDIGTVIGSHTGPGTLALFFWGKERLD